MYYGIDLGTTNSIIGHGESLFTQLVSSNVDIVEKKQVKRDCIGESIVSSYKTEMSLGESGKLARGCSAVILKDLARRAELVTDEKVRNVVISVPAYFSSSQREAVYEAAAEAGMDVKALLNEPTAAALYVCRDMKDMVLVYDLGGGTFDISVVDSRLGFYKVVATDGLVLGGDDLDKFMVEEVFSAVNIPLRLRNKNIRKQLCVIMRNAKETIQKSRSDVCVDLSEAGLTGTYTLTVDGYKEMVRKVFGKTIAKTINLMSKIPTNEQMKIVFVGGSTNCPLLKEMVLEETDCVEVHCDIDADWIVAKGVALYAEMCENGISAEAVEDVTKRLAIKLNSGETATVIEGNSSIPCMGSVIINNDRRSDRVSLELYQGASVNPSNNDYIGTLVFNFDREYEPMEGNVEVMAEVAEDGIITLKAFDILQGEQTMQEIKLLQK